MTAKEWTVYERTTLFGDRWRRRIGLRKTYLIMPLLLCRHLLTTTGKSLHNACCQRQTWQSETTRQLFIGYTLTANDVRSAVAVAYKRTMQCRTMHEDMYKALEWFSYTMKTSHRAPLEPKLISMLFLMLLSTIIWSSAIQVGMCFIHYISWTYVCKSVFKYCFGIPPSHSLPPLTPSASRSRRLWRLVIWAPPPPLHIATSTTVLCSWTQGYHFRRSSRYT